jgi:hypothetical protein
MNMINIHRQKNYKKWEKLKLGNIVLFPNMNMINIHRQKNYKKWEKLKLGNIVDTAYSKI